MSTLTPQAFAAAIRAQYPAYANVPDDELVSRTLAKYPVYRDRVQFPPVPEALVPEDAQPTGLRGMMQRAQGPKRYTVQGPEGRRVTFDWMAGEPPNEADLEEVFAAAGPYLSTDPNAGVPIAGQGAPQRIQLPDGSIGEFPAGMADAEIESVLQREYPATLSAEEFAERYPGVPPPPPGFVSADEFSRRYGSTPETEAGGFGGGLLSLIQRARALDTGVRVGSTKAAGRMAIGLGELVRKAAGLQDQPLGTTAQALGLEPEGGAEQAGAMVTDALAFLAPGAGAARLPLAGKLAAEGVGGALVAGSQGATGKEAATAGALGALGPALGAVRGVVSAGREAGALSRRVINSLIKPTLADTKFGHNPSRAIVNEGLTAGSLEGLAGKVEAKAATIGKEVDAALAPLKQKLDIRPALAPIDDAIGAAIKRGDEALLGRLRHLRDSITHGFEEVGGKLQRKAGGLIKATPAEINRIKREVGEVTRWREGDALASDIHPVGRAVWRKLADLVETAEPKVKGLNSRWADLISARDAIARRVDVQARHNLAGLGPLITGVGGTLTSTVGTGGLDIGDILSGIAFGALTKGAGSTAAKSRLAQMIRPRVTGAARSLRAMLQAQLAGAGESAP